MDSLRRFRALPSLRRRLLAETVFALAVCRVGLAVGSVSATRRALDPTVSFLSYLHRRRAVTPADVVWAVETADALLPGTGTCLRVALVGNRLLAAHGYDSTLRIGVDKGNGGPFEAHAWLERDGRVLLGNLSDLARFRPLPLETAEKLIELP